MVLVDYIGIFFTCGNTFGHILYICKIIQSVHNMRQVQPETLPKNSNFSSCLQNIKLKNNTTSHSGQFSYPLPDIVSFLFEKKSTRV